MRVFIDNREQDRALRGMKYFKTKGYETVKAELVYGDFDFLGDKIKVAFEYKTISDFIQSIEDKRVFNQALNQSNTCDYHFVIIVGNEKDYKKAMSDYGYHSGHYISHQNLNGAIASLVNFTSVLKVDNEDLAFDLMERIALKCISEKPVIHRFPKSRGSPAYRLLANNINGIGEKMAEKICLERGLESIESVFGLNISDLTSIDGIGKKRAENILSQLKSNYN